MSVGQTTPGKLPAPDLPQVEGIEHRFVELDGLRVHVAEAGEGEPLLLLHGWPQHWYMWREVIERLAERFRLIAPDLRGFGWSEAPGSGYDGETFARDQVELLDALDIDSARVMGHDWGGWAAMLLGILYPERVERMVVCNAPHPWPKVTPRAALELWRGWYTWLMATPVLGAAALRRGFPRIILSHGNTRAPFSDSELDLYVEKLREPERAEASVSLYRYYQRAVRDGITGKWADSRLTVPTLLLFGEGDFYVSKLLLEGHEGHADDLQVELVADSGHFIVDEKPDLVARRALAFLS